MQERIRFIGRLLEGEKMAAVCREFGISRVTGHKIWNRYQQDGNSAFYNRSRKPNKHPNQTPGLFRALGMVVFPLQLEQLRKIGALSWNFKSFQEFICI